MIRKCDRDDSYDWLILREEEEDGPIDDNEPGTPGG